MLDMPLGVRFGGRGLAPLRGYFDEGKILNITECESEKLMTEFFSSIHHSFLAVQPGR